MKVYIFTEAAKEKYKDTGINISNEIPNNKMDKYTSDPETGAISINDWNVTVTNDDTAPYLSSGEWIHYDKCNIIKTNRATQPIYTIESATINNLNPGKYTFTFDFLSGIANSISTDRIYGKAYLTIYNKDGEIKGTAVEFNAAYASAGKSDIRLTDKDIEYDNFFYPDVTDELSLAAYINTGAYKATYEFTLEEGDTIEFKVSKTWGVRHSFIAFTPIVLNYNPFVVTEQSEQEQPEQEPVEPVNPVDETEQVVDETSGGEYYETENIED